MAAGRGCVIRVFAGWMRLKKKTNVKKYNGTKRTRVFYSRVFTDNKKSVII